MPSHVSGYLIYFIILVSMCVCGGGGSECRHMMLLWRSEGNFEELILSFHCEFWWWNAGYQSSAVCMHFPCWVFLLALVSCTSVTMIIKHFISDKMKDAIIAKLANQAADYFGDAFKQCQYKDTLPKVSYCLHWHLVILHVGIFLCVRKRLKSMFQQRDLVF